MPRQPTSMLMVGVCTPDLHITSFCLRVGEGPGMHTLEPWTPTPSLGQATLLVSPPSAGVVEGNRRRDSGGSKFPMLTSLLALGSDAQRKGKRPYLGSWILEAPGLSLQVGQPCFTICFKEWRGPTWKCSGVFPPLPQVNSPFMGHLPTALPPSPCSHPDTPPFCFRAPTQCRPMLHPSLTCSLLVGSV